MSNNGNKGLAQTVATRQLNTIQMKKPIFKIKISIVISPSYNIITPFNTALDFQKGYCNSLPFVP